MLFSPVTSWSSQRLCPPFVFVRVGEIIDILIMTSLVKLSPLTNWVASCSNYDFSCILVSFSEWVFLVSLTSPQVSTYLYLYLYLWSSADLRLERLCAGRCCRRWTCLLQLRKQRWLLAFKKTNQNTQTRSSPREQAPGLDVQQWLWAMKVLFSSLSCLISVCPSVALLKATCARRAAHCFVLSRLKSVHF